MTTPYQEGYEQGEWDTQNRLHDEREEMRAEIKALVSTLNQWNLQFVKRGVRQTTLGDAECDVLSRHHTAIFFKDDE